VRPPPQPRLRFQVGCVAASAGGACQLGV
jgi:hypothetical protein